jgi:WD40 repeat protein
VFSLALSPTGDLFAGGNQGHARLFWSDGGTTPTTSIGSYIDAAAFSPRGDLLAIAGTAGRVELLNRDGSARTARFRACQEIIYGFAFSPVADTLATLCEHGVVKLWTLDGKSLGSLLESAAGAARGLAISPSAELLASGRLDGVVGFWKPQSLRLDAALDIGLNIDQVGLHREGSWVLANGNTVFFFDAHRRLVATAVVAPEGVVAFTPDGSFAGSRGAERLVRAFRADGIPLTAAETAERLVPAKVVAALHTS